MTTYRPTPCVLAIGNFDGVHAGHQHLLTVAQNIAIQENLPLHILTFTPHPRTVLRPEIPHAYLMTDTEKEAALLANGAQEVHFLPFTHDLAAQTPPAFEANILTTLLNTKHVVIGTNFRYGNKAAGTPETLSQNPNFTVHTVPLLKDADGVISSTRLREAP